VEGADRDSRDSVVRSFFSMHAVVGGTEMSMGISDGY
jgi:hypothetical protein